MVKKLISVFLTAVIMLSCFSAAVFAAGEEYREISVYFIEEKKTDTVEIMMKNNNVYINAGFFKRFGFEVEEKTDFVMVANGDMDSIPKGALGFYYDSTKCLQVNNAFVNTYEAPFDSLKNGRGSWIPFEYSMYLLNGCVLPGIDVLMISSPRSTIFDLFHNISASGDLYSFDYADDFLYGTGTKLTLDILNRFVKVLNGLITFDGATWVSLVTAGNVTSQIFGDLGYDAEYGRDIARLFCTDSADEVIKAVEDINKASAVLKDDGALGKFLTQVSNANDLEIGELQKKCNEALKKVMNGADVAEYNRLYAQLEDALNSPSFKSVGDIVENVQTPVTGIMKGLGFLSMIVETVSFMNEFQRIETFAVDSLELFAGDLPVVGGEVTFSTKNSMLEGAKMFRTDDVQYSLYRFATEHLDEIIATTLDICLNANLALLAWDLISIFVPFIADGLSANENYELSIYAMCIQNEAYRIYNEHLISLQTKGNITQDDIRQLSKYAYAYLKMCYITRNAACAGIHVLSEEAEAAKEKLIEEQNKINLEIASMLNLAKQSQKDEAYSFLNYPGSSVIDYTPFIVGGDDIEAPETDYGNSTDCYEAYKSILMDHPAFISYESGTETIDIDTLYTLYDIDKDGTAELIVKEDMYNYYVYTYTDGKAELCGEFTWMYDNCLYEYPDKNGIVVFDGGTGTYKVDSVMLLELEDGVLDYTDTLISIIESTNKEVQAYIGKFTLIKNFYSVRDFYLLDELCGSKTSSSEGLVDIYVCESIVLNYSDGSKSVLKTNYDSNGFLISATVDDGDINYYFDSGLFCGRESNDFGCSEEFRYDSDGNLIEESVYVDDEIKYKTTYDYLAGGSVSSSQHYMFGDILGETAYEYDSSGKLIKATHNSGVLNVLEYEYSRDGKLMKIYTTSDAGDSVTEIFYDSAGRMIRVDDMHITGIGSSSFYAYDTAGNLTEYYSSYDGEKDNKTTFVYDADNNMIYSCYDSEYIPYTLDITYDENGNIKKIVNSGDSDIVCVINYKGVEVDKEDINAVKNEQSDLFLNIAGNYSGVDRVAWNDFRDIYSKYLMPENVLTPYH